jgi:hypothetical protein
MAIGTSVWMRRFLLFLMVLFSLNLVLGYDWACYTKGETKPSGTVCENDCCIQCEDDTGWGTDPARCDPTQTCMCDNTGGPPVQQTNITIISPISGQLYFSGKVRLGIILDALATSLRYSIDEGPEAVFCTNCQSLSALVPMSSLPDGLHILTVRVYDGGVLENSKSIEFETDSTAPMVLDAWVSNSTSRIERNFTVSYAEHHLDRISFLFKRPSDENFTQINLTGCSSGQSKTCVVVLDLTKYAVNDSLEYYFLLVDAGARASTTGTTVLGLNEIPGTNHSINSGNLTYLLQKIEHLESDVIILTNRTSESGSLFSSFQSIVIDIQDAASIALLRLDALGGSTGEETDSGCAYDDPVCASGYTCQNNVCIAETTPIGCAYDKPACAEGYQCTDNVCIEVTAAVRFRTNIENHNYAVSSGEVAVDADGDGELECFRYFGFYSGYSPRLPVILARTMENYEVHKYTGGKVIIKDSNKKPIYAPSDSCTIPLSKYPVEGYADKEAY